MCNNSGLLVGRSTRCANRDIPLGQRQNASQCYFSLFTHIHYIPPFLHLLWSPQSIDPFRAPRSKQATLQLHMQEWEQVSLCTFDSQADEQRKQRTSQSSARTRNGLVTNTNVTILTCQSVALLVASIGISHLASGRMPASGNSHSLQMVDKFCHDQLTQLWN